MAADFPWPEEATLPIAAQIQAMNDLFPEFKYNWDRNIVEWIGEIRPTEISDTYKIKIRYGLKKYPLVWVVEPALDEAFLKDDNAHIYRQEGNLCLFYPKYNEWTPGMLIAETIVPWTYKWLLFYGGWLITGQWKGGGIPHKPVRESLFRPARMEKRRNV